MTEQGPTAILRDSADVEIVVHNAWSPRLRPRTLRWCRLCASDSCALSDHPSLTFTASMLHHDGRWSYVSSDRWTNTASRTAQTRPIVVLNQEGVVVSHDYAPTPPPETWLWQGHVCALWCADALGVTQYRVEGA